MRHCSLGGLSRGWPARAVALAVALAGCSNSGGSGSGSASKPSQADAEAALPAIYATLDEVRDGLPDPAHLEERECPDDQIVGWSPDPNNRTLAVISYEQLLRKTGTAIPDGVRSKLTSGMSTNEMGWIPPKGEAGRTDPRLARRWEHAHYLAVILKSKESLPDAGAAIGGAFTGGLFEGWIVVFRKQTAEPLCAVHVAAGSSAATGFSMKAGARPDEVQARAQHEAEQDLRRQVGREMSEALGRASRALKLINPGL